MKIGSSQPMIAAELNCIVWELNNATCWKWLLAFSVSATPSRLDTDASPHVDGILVGNLTAAERGDIDMHAGRWLCSRLVC